MMRRCQELIGRSDPTDFTWIPEDDAAALKLCRTGRPYTGIFQFDGYAMAKGGKALGVKSTMDTVLAGALFRPAVMELGLDAEYIERRKNKRLRDAVTYPHPVFEKNLQETYGIVVFQEQVIQIMRDLGMSIAGINSFFDAVKDSAAGSGKRNQERFDKVYKEFADLCAQNGITDVKAAWNYVEGYVSYGFNKAHSTGYGIRGYRGAYLKAHYPLEFMSALLEVSVGQDKEQHYVAEARRMGIRVLPPEVNISGEAYTIDRKVNAIRRGFTAIKGIGPAAAAAIVEERDDNGEYTSVEDLIQRVPARAVSGGAKYLKDKEWTGTLKILREQGCLESLGE
jgi:DNA polymerase-3 subunit alpha